MKTMTAEMKDYLARGMREELGRDTNDCADENVRWHIGMVHETTNTVRMWMECVELGQEANADFHFSVLENAYEWWKNYFDVSPQYARSIEEAKAKELIDAYAKEKERREQDTLTAFENL